MAASEDSVSSSLKPTGNSVIRGALRKRWRSVAAGALFMAGHQTGESLVPVAIGFFIDRAVATGDYAELIPGVLAVALVFGGLSNSWRFGAGFVQHAFKGTEHDLRVAIVRRVLDPAGSERRLTGELLNIATVDAERVGRIASVLATASGAFAALAVTTVVLLRISVPLGLLVILGSIPLLAMVRSLGRMLEKHSGVEQAEAARAAGIANDLVSGLRILKGIGAEDAAIERYRQASRSSLSATVRAARTQAAFQGLNLALTGAFLALVAYVGGRMAAEGRISVGDLIAALGLSQFLLGPMMRLTNIGAMFARSRASASRIASVLAEPERYVSQLEAAGSIRGSVVFEGFGAGSLRNLNVSIEAGEIVGIAVADPTDALTILDCLEGTRAPDEGRVLLDGRPLSEIPAEALHRTIVVAPHDSYLFAETLLANVRAAAPADDVEWAIEASAADEVASNLPDGIETLLSEGGRSLSGGQRQRVALARALASSPPVLVLHDPTTAVDSVTEARIAGALREARRGGTTVLVTTSPVLLAVTDRVVFIEGGVLSQAQHAALMDSKADYRELVVS